MATLAEECVENVLRALETYAMLHKGEKVLAAVSGGPDSMCLLDVLQSRWKAVETAYFDHRTRDGASADDGAFVEEQARLRGLPCHVESRPVEDEARAAGASFEAYARSVRYEFLERVAKANGCGVIATGHHADDQAETVLMRVLRGTTPRGLAGIPPVREEEGVRIVRSAHLLHA